MNSTTYLSLIGTVFIHMLVNLCLTSKTSTPFGNIKRAGIVVLDHVA